MFDVGHEFDDLFGGNMYPIYLNKILQIFSTKKNHRIEIEQKYFYKREVQATVKY